MAETRLSIGEAAERTGMSIHTLRFYERAGLLASPVRRESNGRRRYDEDDLEWLEICSSLRSSGMPLTAIRRYAELVRAGAGNEAERLELLRTHRERVTEQIADLHNCLEVIDYKVTVYEKHVDAGTAGQLWTGNGIPEDCPS